MKHSFVTRSSEAHCFFLRGWALLPIYWGGKWTLPTLALIKLYVYSIGVILNSLTAGGSLDHAMAWINLHCHILVHYIFFFFHWGLFFWRYSHRQRFGLIQHWLFLFCHFFIHFLLMLLEHQSDYIDRLVRILQIAQPNKGSMATSLGGIS